MILLKYVLLFLLLNVKSISYSSNGLQPFGINLPAGTLALGNNRFQSRKSYEETVKDMKQRCKNMKALAEINLPHVRALSLQNTNAQATLRAINIYLNIQTGITQIYFVANS